MAKLKDKVDIKPNGDICEIEISRDGESVALTREQAVSLAKQLLQRYGTPDIGGRK